MKEIKKMNNSKNVKMKSKFSLSKALMFTVFAILMLYAISVIGILAWGLLTSFKGAEEFAMFSPLGFPNLDNYALPPSALEETLKNRYGYNFVRAIKLMSDGRVEGRSYLSIFTGLGDNGKITIPSRAVDVGEILFNTFVWTILCQLLLTFTCMTVAYFCAKYKYFFSKVIFVTVTVAMSIPTVGANASMIDFMQKFAIFDTYLGMFLSHLSFRGTYFLVFFAFFQGVSDSYIEAAEIDGASQIRTYLWVVFPLASKTFLTVFMMHFVGAWNDYQQVLLFFPTHYTFAFTIFKVQSISALPGVSNQSEWIGTPQRIAAAMLLALPMVIFFTAFNKVLLGDLSVGGVKE